MVVQLSWIVWGADLVRLFHVVGHRINEGGAIADFFRIYTRPATTFAGGMLAMIGVPS